MDIITEAFLGIYPDREFSFKSAVKYSGRFKEYNAYVKMYGSEITFHLSKKWRGVDRSIVMGLLQELMGKLFRKKYGVARNTMEQDLYSSFVKSLHMVVPKQEGDEQLVESFERINERYFLGLVDRPNLVFGKHSVRKLGSYDFHTDTISVSRIFEDCDSELLDYVMYHEILHKQVKFDRGKSRTRYHTTKFRELEKEFEGQKEIEERINSLIRSKKVRKKRFWFMV